MGGGGGQLSHSGGSGGSQLSHSGRRGSSSILTPQLNHKVHLCIYMELALYKYTTITT